jgi:hypothetical protein
MNGSEWGLFVIGAGAGLFLGMFIWPVLIEYLYQKQK